MSKKKRARQENEKEGEKKKKPLIMESRENRTRLMTQKRGKRASLRTSSWEAKKTFLARFDSLLSSSLLEVFVHAKGPISHIN